MINKVLILSDTDKFTSELEALLKKIAPKALVLLAASDEAEIYASSFEDPGCLVFLAAGIEEAKNYLKTSKCTVILLQGQAGALNDQKVHGTLFTDKPLPAQRSNVEAFVRLAFFNKEGEKITAIDQVLSNLSERMGQELKRVKGLHEKLVSFRSEEYKGIKVTSKFASGEKPGGEFFDVVNAKKGPIFILSSTNSYVASSIVMSHIEALYLKKVFDEEILNLTMSQIEKEFLSLGLDLSTVGVAIFEIELSTMKLKMFSFGGVKVWHNENEVFRSGSLRPPFSAAKDYMWETKLERSDRLLILSPGFSKNMTRTLESKIPTLMKAGAREFLTGAFFELKKETDNSFLQYDASAIYFEVDAHAILQV